MDVFVVRNIFDSKTELPFDDKQVIKQDNYLNIKHYLNKLKKIKEENISSIYVKWHKFNKESKSIDGYFVKMDLDYINYTMIKLQEKGFKHCIVKLGTLKGNNSENIFPYFQPIEEDVIIGTLDMHCGECHLIDNCADAYSPICLCGNELLKDMSVYDYLILVNNDEVRKLYEESVENKILIDIFDEYKLKTKCIYEVFTKLEKE